MRYKVTTLRSLNGVPLAGVPKHKIDMLHRLPPKSFRSTRCGETSPVIFERWLPEDIKKHKNLCPECWMGIKQIANRFAG